MTLPAGFFPDIWVDDAGAQWVVYQQGRDAECWLVSYREGELASRLLLAPGSQAFPRLAADQVLYRDGQTLVLSAPVWALGLGTVVWTGVIGGNDPVAASDTAIAWQAHEGGAYQVWRAADALSTPTLVRHGAPTGLSRILADGTVRLVDEDRQLLTPAGLRSRPCWARDGAVIVERHVTGNRGAELWSGDMSRCAVLWPGQDAFTPRVCRAPDGTYHATAWGADGVLVATVRELPIYQPAPVEPPPPAPDPIPEVPPMTVPETRDLTVVGVSHLRALTWPITATVTRVTCEPARIILDHSKAGRWPVVNDDGTALEGCLWAIVHVGGRWCAGTIDYLRPGQIEKHIPPAEYVARWKAAGLETRVPASGELVGVFVSTLARQGQRSPVDERSQIVWTRVGTSDIVAREPLVADPVPVPAPPSLPEHPDMAKPYPSEQWLIDVIGADLHEWAQARGFVGDLAHGSYLGSRAAARILQDYHGENLSLEASIAKHRPALREELGLDPR